MSPRVAEVHPAADFTLELVFTNGETGVYDCRPILTFGVFRELQDLPYFLQAKVLGGTVTWPHEQDICPDTLYEECRKSAGRSGKSALRPNSVSRATT